MATTAIPIDTLPSINPATGEVLAHFERTRASSLPEFVSRARTAQRDWAKVPIRDRCTKLRELGDRIMASRNELADAVVRESGKPRVEALFADIFVALDSAEYWSRNAANALRTQRLSHHSTAAKAKRGEAALGASSETRKPRGPAGIAGGTDSRLPRFRSRPARGSPRA